MQRRKFIQLMSLGLAGSWQKLQGQGSALISAKDEAVAAYFPQSVASGDPTHNGAILWTRIHPKAILHQAEPVYFELSRSEDFRELLYRGKLSGRSLSYENDFTIKVDLCDHCPQVIQPGTYHYYRFRYRQVYSRTGRFKSLPAATQHSEGLRIAVLTCQNYSHGFFHALDDVATDDLDFVLQLGDFIYEYSQIRAVADPVRRIDLGDKQVAHTLDDYRSIYQQYRMDTSLQRAMEKHAWVITWDDHETANNCHWNYQEDSLGMDSRHPLASTSPARRRQLKLDAQKAWSEYVPARVSFNKAAKHPFAALQIYRSIQAGPLLDLFVTDTRSYRSPQACQSQTGETDQYESRCRDHLQAHSDSPPKHIMLGKKQRDWLLSGMQASQARWKLWANQTLFSQLALRNPINSQPLAFLGGFDGWDGYQSERQVILDTLTAAKIEGLLICTGDMHTYIASHILSDFNAKGESGTPLGLEIMTPAVSSPNLATMLSHWGYRKEPSERSLKERLYRFLGRRYLESELWAKILNEQFIQAMNPHFEDFCSTINGYTVLEIKADRLDWHVYQVPIKPPQRSKAMKSLFCSRSYDRNTGKVTKF